MSSSVLYCCSLAMYQLPVYWHNILGVKCIETRNKTYSFHLLYSIASATGIRSLGCPTAPLKETRTLNMKEPHKTKELRIT